MTVATRDYGAKDFDYPVIELSNYSASFTKAKVIGDDENPKNEGKSVVNNEPVQDAETPSAPEVPQKTLNAAKEASTDTKQSKPQSAPVPQAKSSGTKSAPIPMAVPESLR